MKVYLSLLALAAIAVAEPPVNGLNPPSSQYGPPADTYGPPANTYGPPTHTQAILRGNGNGNGHRNGNGNHRNGNGRPSAQYGPPKPVYGAPAEEEAPASYHFEYAVKDEESGNDFGHEESREGDVAQGKYYVLLPDGRKQIVEYTADTDGYHPTITYEETGNGNGYPRGPANGNGYPRGPANGRNGNGGYKY